MESSINPWNRALFARRREPYFRDEFAVDSPLQRRVYCEPEFSGGYPINARRTFQLQQRGIEKIIVVGVLANTCVEATARCRAKGRSIEEIDAALAKPRSLLERAPAA